MLNLSHSKKRIDQISVSTLADDIVFTLGDYIRSKRVKMDIVDLGIELCDAILRGEKVKLDKMKIEEISDYERYQIIKKGSQFIEERGIELVSLPQKVEDTKSILEKIKNNIPISKEIIEDIQHFFIAISTPFWRVSVEDFRQRKLAEGYR